MPDLPTPVQRPHSSPSERSARQATFTLGELYHSHRGALVRLVRPLVDTVEAAEEIVHDVFARMLRSGRLPNENPAGYLRTAAINAARSELRRREVARRHYRRLASEQLVEVGQALDDSLVQRFDILELGTHIGSLAPRQRDVIELRFIEGLREREVAERLGISAGSVKTHTSRGLQALRARLTEEGAVA